LPRYLTRQVRRDDRDMADDLAQIVFLRAWEALPGVQLATAEVERAWLCTIAKHVVVDHYRRSGAQQRARETATDPTDPAAWHAEGVGAIGEDSDDVCARVDLQRSLAAATAAQREIVRLRVVEELPWAVVASRTRQGKACARRSFEAATAAVTD
jgi:RNA polymerase sigma-70 factor (ECF subfamily)